MKISICYIITFLVCLVLKLTNLWWGFAAVLSLFLLKKINGSILWEIPMGVLACSILTDIFAEETVGLLRVLIPLAAVLVAYSSPKKLWIFFPLALLSLVMKNMYAVSMIWAALWYGGREFIVRCQLRIFNSTIKKRALQGNNFE